MSEIYDIVSLVQRYYMIEPLPDLESVEESEPEFLIFSPITVLLYLFVTLLILTVSRYIFLWRKVEVLEGSVVAAPKNNLLTKRAIIQAVIFQ